MPNEHLHINSNASNQGRIGVIDIGSNSIRFVVYDKLKRAPSAIYNEKVMCQLGKGLAKSGKLNPEGVKMARDAIARYVALARNMEVTELDVIATAAMRDATDGEAFAIELEKKHQLHIDTISGTREARLGAYGILSSMHQPKGITGDLGGGSMELVVIEEGGTLGDRISLPIGPLRLLDECTSIAEIEKKARQQLKNLPWLPNKPEQFYAIGGSFRAIAQIHMQQEHYPLHVVHGYQLKSEKLIPFLDFIMQTDVESLAKMDSVPTKRAPILPASAAVLKTVLELLQAKHITFSASGIREGFLFEKLSPFIRTEDGLIASCSEFANKTGRSIAYANELFEWMQPALGELKNQDARLAYAFCLMHDVARYIHPEYRAEWSFTRTIQSGLTGLTHPERVQLALALYHRHRFKLKEPFKELSLIEERARIWALLVGSLANLAYHLTGGIAGSLQHMPLDASKQKMALKLDKESEVLMGDAIKKRLGGVEEAFQLWKKFR
jgi:exopolyphosphatase/guanosine-5'-triphosphate,3'-diphosphate pyrophosphatase